MRVSLRVNGERHEADVAPMKRLLDLLREDLGLTGTKEGCGEGECGACTVTLDGVPVLSCMVPACQADGTSVGTVEGLATNGDLSVLQRAFLHGGAQCGICTPGILVAAHAAIASRRTRLTREDIRFALAGNLCRCTGYVKIFEAVEAADRAIKKRSDDAPPSRQRVPVSRK
jgi:carbon-monoxide dehydrogenase small subunit